MTAAPAELTFPPMDLDELHARFRQLYGRPAAGLAQAPGRVNLIGEHTDYNDGLVLPIAIERHVVAALSPRDDRTIYFASGQADQPARAGGSPDGVDGRPDGADCKPARADGKPARVDCQPVRVDCQPVRADCKPVRVDLDGPIRPGLPKWANYCLGVVAGLARRGVVLRGADVLFASDIPIGAGLSSSAALEVCTATALLAAAGQTGAVADRELALLCQRAENDFAGAPCGIMDQSIAVMAKKGHALLLDCRTGLAEQVPFDNPQVVLLVVDTRVRHEIGGGEYGRRRDRCAAAAEKLGVAALRDVDSKMLDAAAADGLISSLEERRARHVVTEIARTRQAVAALKNGDYPAFGELMYASHASLRDDYQVSCEELDAVVEIAGRCRGVLGARMTGGGFGGSAIILAARRHGDEIAGAVASGFADRFGRRCGVFTTAAEAGAGVLE